MNPTPVTARGTLIPVFAPEWADVFGEDDSGIFAECSVGTARFIWRWIPPGKFWMGSEKESRVAFDDEKPRHEVTISAGFWLGETPVTQEQWRAVTGESPSQFQGDDLPVERVSWDDAVAFAERLREAKPGLWARLPTEAQWEYACRAGTEGDFHDGSRCTEAGGADPALEKLAWFTANSGQSTHAVKDKLPNAWGLYDMLGNVWEWCRDARRVYAEKAELDPTGSLDDPDERAIRGGSWRDPARCCRCAYRFWILRSFRFDYLGLRLAAGQELQPAEPGSAEPTGAERPAGRPEGRGRPASD